MVVDLGAIGITLGLEVLKRTAPRGISWLSTYAQGVEILIVGPSAAGKTSFANYLSVGALHPATAEHYKTTDVQHSSTFSVSMGRDESLRLKVRRTTDVPGQFGALNHANIVRDRKPHGIVILLSASMRDNELRNWITEFGERMEAIIAAAPQVRRRLRAITVILNKRDRVADATLARRTKLIRGALKESLTGALGTEHVKNIPVVPCVSVQTQEYGTSPIDAAIVRMAIQLRK